MEEQMIDIDNPVTQDALAVFAEAVTYIKEQRASRAFSLLHDGDGSFTVALESDEISPATREWLYNLRSTLCDDLY
jgi:hypothetical protein